MSISPPFNRPKIGMSPICQPKEEAKPAGRNPRLLFIYFFVDAFCCRAPKPPPQRPSILPSPYRPLLSPSPIALSILRPLHIALLSPWTTLLPPTSA